MRSHSWPIPMRSLSRNSVRIKQQPALEESQDKLNIPLMTPQEVLWFEHSSSSWPFLRSYSIVTFLWLTYRSRALISSLRSCVLFQLHFGLIWSSYLAYMKLILVLTKVRKIYIKYIATIENFQGKKLIRSIIISTFPCLRGYCSSLLRNSRGLTCAVVYIKEKILDWAASASFCRIRILLPEEFFCINWLLLLANYYFSGFRSLPTFRTLFLGGWFWSEGWRAWLGLTTITDLLEFCFWFLSPLSFTTWLLMIQLLWTILLSLPYSLARRPIRPSLLISLSFLISASLDFLKRLETLVYFTTLGSLIWLANFMLSCDWACDFRMFILSCSRSLILCSFLT